MKNTIILLLLLATIVSCSPYSVNNEIESFYNYPNPFSSKNEYTTFKVVLKESYTIVSADVSIYNSDGNLIDTFALTTISDEVKSTAEGKWRGVDKLGNALPASIYYSEVSVKDDKGATLTSSQKVSIK